MVARSLEDSTTSTTLLPYWRIGKVAGIRGTSARDVLRHAAITNALDAGRCPRALDEVSDSPCDRNCVSFPSLVGGQNLGA